MTKPILPGDSTVTRRQFLHRSAAAALVATSEATAWPMAKLHAADALWAHSKAIATKSRRVFSSSGNMGQRSCREKA